MRRLLTSILMIISVKAFAVPGDLVGSKELAPMNPQQIQPLLDRYCPGVKNKLGDARLRVFAIQYETTDLNGQATEASGAVFLPDTGTGPFALVTYQHGTVLLHNDVPSHENAEGVLAGTCYGSQNDMIAMADYLGYGDSKVVHPYLIVQTEVTASVDMLRAARKFAAQMNVNLSPKLFVTGYSQGGGAAMALHKYLQEHLSAEFPVTASTPMAGPYDLENTFLSVVKNPAEHSVTEFAYFAWSMNPVYHFGPALGDIIEKPWVDQLDGLFDGHHNMKDVVAALPSDFSKFLVAIFVQTAESDTNSLFRQTLRANNVNDWVPQAPMFLLQGASDIEVSTDNTLKTCAAMKQAGAPVDCYLIPGLGHQEAFAAALPMSVDFFSKMKN